MEDEAAHTEARLQGLVLEERAAARTATEEADRWREACRQAEEQLKESAGRARRAEAAEAEAAVLRDGQAALERQLREAQAQAARELAARPAGSGGGGSMPLPAALAEANATIAEQRARLEALERRLAEVVSSTGGGGTASAAGMAALGGAVLESVLHAPSATTPDAAAAVSFTAGPATGAHAPTVAAALHAAEARQRESSEENEFLKHELAELQAALKRSDKGVSLTFLKNVLVRYMKEGDLENSLPVIAQALELSQQEISDIRASQPGALQGVGRALKLW